MITNSTITEHNTLQAFRSKILSKLLSEPAYDYITKINTNIRLPPSKNFPIDTKIHSCYKPENESQIIAPSYSPLWCSKTYHGGSAMSVVVYHKFINNFLKPTELSPYMERRLLAICREFLSRVNVDMIAPDY